VALSQLKELGEQAIVAIAASLACGGPVVRGQLIASRFYEALRHELKQSPMHDTNRAALMAASDRCERIAAASINPSTMLDELRKAIAVLQAEEQERQLANLRWLRARRREPDSLWFPCSTFVR
jgi:hypothetical protein